MTEGGGLEGNSCGPFKSGCVYASIIIHPAGATEVSADLGDKAISVQANVCNG